MQESRQFSPSAASGGNSSFGILQYARLKRHQAIDLLLQCFSNDRPSGTDYAFA